MRKKSLQRSLLALAIGAVCVPCAVMGIGALQATDNVVATAETAIEYTAPTAKEGLVYNGQEQELINAGIVPDGYTMVYRLNWDDTTETTEIPTGKGCGAYTIDYKILDGEGNVVVDYMQDVYAYIDMATLTVTAVDMTVEQYVWENFNPTYTVEGFIGDDNFFEDDNQQPTFQGFDSLDTVGEYDLLFDESYGYAENYTITYVPGKITVYEHTECRGGEDYPTCMGYICAYCEEYYGEPTADAHDWNSYTGICYHCKTSCTHEEQTVYCIGSICGICGFNCDETNKNENVHLWNRSGKCLYCYTRCPHESCDEITSKCDVCNAATKDVAVIVGDSITLYDDFFEGIANAPENATVKLLRTRMFEDSYEINKSVTIDLNGNWIEDPSSNGISFNVPVVIVDSVGGGGFDIGTRFYALCELKGGSYRYVSVNVEGKNPSDLLANGYHFYQNQNGVGKDAPMTDEEVDGAYDVWVLCDCTHTYSDWEITKQPTETEKGEKTRVCSICERVEKEELPMATSGEGEQGGSTTPTDEEEGGCKSSISYAFTLGALVIGAVCVKARKRKE